MPVSVINSLEVVQVEYHITTGELAFKVIGIHDEVVLVVKAGHGIVVTELFEQLVRSIFADLQPYKDACYQDGKG